jgi:hypothetical protein
LLEDPVVTHDRASMRPKDLLSRPHRVRRYGRAVLSSLAIAWIASTGQTALAFGGTARELERQGNFAVTNNAEFGFNHQIGHGDGTTFTLRPALDYFVVDRLSVGGAVQFDFASGGPGNPDSTTFEIAPDVGYEFALSDTWSFWPQASVPMSFPNRGNATLTLVIFAPFLIHPAEHFFFGIGPGFSQGLTSNPTTSITGAFLIGGYFDH